MRDRQSPTPENLAKFEAAIRAQHERNERDKDMRLMWEALLNTPTQTCCEAIEKWNSMCR